MWAVVVSLHGEIVWACDAAEILHLLVFLEDMYELRRKYSFATQAFCTDLYKQ